MRTPREDEDALTTAGDHGTQLDAYDTTGGSPPSRRRRNFKRDYPAAYNDWRNRRRYAETHLKRKVSDTEYIRRFEAGKWPTENVQVCDNPPEFIAMPVSNDDIDTNYGNSLTSERERPEDEQTTSADTLRCRPIWHLKRFDSHWHWAEWEDAYDPISDQERDLDSREKKLAAVNAALRVRKRDRYAALDHVLDTISDEGTPEDADYSYAEYLVDYVREREPGYFAACKQKKANFSQRGRKRKDPAA